jgi:hypothetical protein
MKVTKKDLLELQQLFMENKEKWEEEGVIEGQGGRQDGYKAEQLVHNLLGWNRNNLEDKLAPDFYIEGYGYSDLKLGAPKLYNKDTFLLEVIQNPSKGMQGLSAWTYTGTVDYLLYLDMSDDTFPLYFFSVKQLIKEFSIHNFIDNVKQANFDYYNRYWRKSSKLVPPRNCDDSVKPFSCFGKKALGYELPTDMAVGKLLLIDFIGEEDERTTDSTVRVSGSDKEKTNSNLRRTKK